MAKSIKKTIIEKSVNALISAIEIYNKPDFKYREESFCVLMVNAWELLLKAKILDENGNDKKSLYIKYHPKNINGHRSARWEYKLARTGNKQTIGLLKCLELVKQYSSLDSNTEANIKTLTEYRDNAIHFYNPSLKLAKSLHEVGSGSIISFLNLLHEWFGATLERYNLYLLPLSFFSSGSYTKVPSLNEEKLLLDFIEEEKRTHPFDKNSLNNYAVYIKVDFGSKSSKTTGIHLTNNPNTPGVHLSDEELSKKYPLSYAELIEKCSSRYSDFKLNQDFHNYRKQYLDNLKFCYPRYPNLKQTGDPRYHYSTGILEEFDKKYTKV